jgi:hypothetical protein
MLACIAVCLAASLLAGCATTNQLVPAATGPIPANFARIVVSRGSGFVGAAAPIGIIDSGKQIGAVGLNDQISWDRIAGSMELVGFNTLSPPSAERVQPLRVCVGAGRTYQFRVSWPTFSSKWFPDIELVSGTPVACEQAGTTSTVKEDSSASAQAIGPSSPQTGTVPAGKVLIYIYRPPGQTGFAAFSGNDSPPPFGVKANGKTLITLVRGGYYAYLTEPGQIEFTTFEVGFMAPSSVFSIAVDAKAQHTYYLKGRHGKGAFGKAQLEFVSPEVGAQEVANCKLISSP